MFDKFQGGRGWEPSVREREGGRGMGSWSLEVSERFPGERFPGECGGQAGWRHCPLKDGNSTLRSKHGVVQAQAGHGHEGLECGSRQ